jgi:hypothetical protein
MHLINSPESKTVRHLFMKRFLINMAIALALVSLAATNALAQKGKKQTASDPLPKVISEANAPQAAPKNDGEIVKAASIYKTSLKQLLAVRETEATQTADRLDKLKALYTDGLISKRELEETERSLVEARHKVEEVRKQLTATDAVVVESLADNEGAQVAEFDPLAASSKMIKKVAYIRYRGNANWSVGDVSKIEKFFQTKFRRALPVAALGQSDLHSRWGYDHRNAVDVAVHPDTAEGQALMSYLSGQGIPFMAFRRAVPGSATGPHIHIGKPSQKTSK